MAVLNSIVGPIPGAQFVLRGERAELGRSPDCEVVLDAAAVSRRHAAITRENDRYFVEDLGSRNGTFLNGHRVESKSPIFDGDQLQVCDLSFEFRLTSESEQLAESRKREETALPFILDDEGDSERSTSRSTITSKLEVSTNYGTVHLSAKPEIKLSAILEISRGLSRTLSVNEILPRLLDSLFKVFLQADRAFVVMNDTESNRLVPSAMRHRRERDEEVVRISQTIARRAMEQKEAILSADATSDQRFSMAESVADFRIRSMMCAPMVDMMGNPLGVIQVDTMNQRSRFMEEDLEVLASVASQAAMAIDNARMAEEAWKQRALSRDMELAHRVQRGLVPSKTPDVAGYHFFHFYDAAYQVGGDYYDYVPLSDGKWAVVVGDVAGKGVSAALLMAKLSGDVRFHLASEPDPAIAVRNINNSFMRRDWEDRFVTMVVAVLDPCKQSLTLVNAGHMPPLLRHSGGTVEEVGEDQAGLPLGVVEDFPYESYTREIAEGDFLTVFTDGISEAMNADKELYGLERLSRQVGSRAMSVVELGEHILADVREFVGGQQQSDDMCLACFGREESTAIDR